MATVAAVILAKNEAARLPRCLASVAWCDRIVVVDDESTDGTAALAEAAGAVVLRRALDHYDAQRNAGADAAGCDWVLAVDADEEVTPELAAEVREAIARPDAMDVYAVPFRHCIFGEWPRHGHCNDPRTRLHRASVRWQGSVHEQLPRVKGRFDTLRGEMIHHSHETVFAFIEKLNRYTEREAAERAASCRQPSVAKMLLAPVRDFWRRYVVKQGFRDGHVGLILCLLMAFYVFTVRAKAWEIRRAQRRSA